MSYNHLTENERYQIYILKKQASQKWKLQRSWGATPLQSFGSCVAITG